MQNEIDRSFSETFPLAWTERYTDAVRCLGFCLQAPKEGFTTMRACFDGSNPEARSTHIWRIGTTGANHAAVLATLDPFQTR